MKAQTFRFDPSLTLAFVALFAFGLATSIPVAAGSKSSSSSSSKPAPAARPAASSKPASGGSSGSSSSGHPGGAAAEHSTITTGNAAGHVGATTSNPSGRVSPTTSNPTGHVNATTWSPSGRGPAAPVAPGRSASPGRAVTGDGGGLRGANTPARTAVGGRAPVGSHTIATGNGAVTRRADGRLSDVHDARRGMDVHHGLNGSRRVSVERADHSRIMAERGRPGYIERGYSFHGHDYGRRAYYWHGHEYNRFYRGYYYHGAYLSVYAPGVFFAPGFYGWAYNPWGAPVNYSWGWAGSPWYGYYGNYFAPYPVYAAPADWLTDYVISQDLASAYAAQQDAQLQVPAPAAAGGQPLMTPKIKQQIADEVRAQIALENSEAQQNTQGQEADPASSGVNRMFNDGRPHVFVATSSLDVVDAGGNECALSDGDVLKLTSAPAGDATDANVSVMVSKGGKECPAAAMVTVAIADLQEMQNGMRATVDQGMQELQANQGKGGLPAAPPSAMVAPVQAAIAQAAPPPEANVAAEVNQQLTLADQVDSDAAHTPALGALSTPAAIQPTATINIAVGQSIADVTAALGQPASVIDLGTKKIYKYKDMKVTFKEGKVADVD